MDSDHLRDQLIEDSAYGKTSSKQINIFIFSHDSPRPVLIDKHYQARSLDNLVVAVQSSHPKWPSQYSCNSKVIYLNLRDPTKAILSATIQSLFGTFSSNQLFDESDKAFVDEWMWSVGQGPDSITTSDSHYSAFDIDLVRRIQVVLYLQKAVSELNEGVKTLQTTQIEMQNINMLSKKTHDLDLIKKMYFKITQELDSVSLSAAFLDYESILEKVFVFLGFSFFFIFFSFSFPKT